MNKRVAFAIAIFFSIFIIVTPAAKYVAEFYFLRVNKIKYGNSLNIADSYFYISSEFFLVGREGEQYALSKAYDFSENLILISSTDSLGFELESLLRKGGVKKIPTDHRCLIYRSSVDGLADYFIEIEGGVVISFWQDSDYVTPNELCRLLFSGSTHTG